VIDFRQELEEVRRLEATITHLEAAVREDKDYCDETTLELKRAEEALGIVQVVSQAIQEMAHKKISDVVSTCLSSVFDDPYQFKIVFERKRGRTEALLRFSRRDVDADPLHSCGGGAVDVAAFGLRASCLMLRRPRLSRVLVIDEGFKFVSAQYREPVREMLEEISKDLGVQIIQVTHSPEYETGHIFEL